MKVLVLNSGSSSQKSALFDLEQPFPLSPPEPTWQAHIEWNAASGKLEVRNHATIREEVEVQNRGMAIERLLGSLTSGSTKVIDHLSEVQMAGHRIVHGGPHLRAPAEITPEVKRTIAATAEFAPLHNRAELEGIQILERLAPHLRQVAVFDTGFHSTIPDAAAVYPGPYEWVERGIRRYGFHGINHEYCAVRAAQLLGRDLATLRLVSCHLGNGCSLAAIRGGSSVDTTMGFTPLEGLMMGTRSGSVDPGILTYLMREGALTGEQIDDVLNKRSGLLGVSGTSGDMREIQEAVRKGEPRAKLAFEIYVHRLRKGIAAMAAVLGGMDALIFTAGVGEHSAEVRAEACAALSFLDVKIDEEKNASSPPDTDIAAVNSAVRVLIIRAQEDWAIAKSCYRIAQAN